MKITFSFTFSWCCSQEPRGKGIDIVFLCLSYPCSGLTCLHSPQEFTSSERKERWIKENRVQDDCTNKMLINSWRPCKFINDSIKMRQFNAVWKTLAASKADRSKKLIYIFFCINHEVKNRLRRLWWMERLGLVCWMIRCYVVEMSVEKKWKQHQRLKEK